MDKVDADVERVIEKYRKIHLIGVLSLQYPSLEGNEKEQCFAELKRLLIEIYGIFGLSNV
jgi:hypothetical protein